MRRSVIIVLGTLVILVAGFNIFLESPSFDNNKELVEYAMVSKQYQLAEKTYSELMESDSTNLDYYYGHIRSHFRIPGKSKLSRYVNEIRDDTFIFEFYESKSKSKDLLQKDIGFYCLGLCYSFVDSYDEALSCLEKVENRNLKYLNNTIGYIYLVNERFDVATGYLLKEIENEGNVNGAYSNLIELYLKTNQLDRIKELIDGGKRDYFSTSDLNEYYFKISYLKNYLAGIFSIGYSNVDLKGLIAALLIVIVWLFYLRKIDVYEPEKWRFVIITFLFGILFSYGTFIMSDINNHLFDFNENGQILNDFLYCFIGIGLVEEFMKLIPFLLMLKFTKALNEPIDYIIYPSISALGFAFAENILYFHWLGLDIIHGRALISVVIHMICSSLVGYGLYFGIRRKVLKKWQRILVFLLLAAFLHGFFDFWIINEKVSSFALVSSLVTLIGLLVWNSFINKALNYTPTADPTTKDIQKRKLQDYLIYGLSAILLFEYAVVSVSYGPKAGNDSLIGAISSGAYLIAFISVSLSAINLRKSNKVFLR